MPASDLQCLNSDTRLPRKVYQHEDVTHDVQFNWYGDMLATCSSDHRVKIWEKLTDGTWDVVKEITAHYSPVWRVSWAHPDYGVIFATCSMDHRATIWRMVNDDKTNWVKKELTDSSSPVTDVKFAPRTWSDLMMPGRCDDLRLATCSEDKVRLYTVQLNSELNETYCYCTPENIIDYSAESGSMLSCLSWNVSNRFSGLVLAVGVVGGRPGSRVDLYSFSEDQVSDRSRWIDLVWSEAGMEDNNIPPTNPPVQLKKFLVVSLLSMPFYKIPKKWSKIATIPLKSKLYHLAFRPNNGAKDNVLAVATEFDLAVYRISADVDQSDESQPELIADPVQKYKEEQGKPIKHVSWDLFGKQIVTLLESGVVKSYSWRFQPKMQWTAQELVSNMDLINSGHH